MKKFFSILFLTLLALGNVWAVDPDYTLTPTAGSNNSYTGNCDVEIGGITWNVSGNAQQVPWRIGGKSISNTDRAVYSKTAYTSAVSKIDLTVGAASSITVNSLKLVYSTNSDFSSSTEISGAFAASSTISFAPASGDFPKNAYYKFVFNVTVSGTSNKFVEFKQVDFYNASSGDPDPEEPTLESIAVSGTPTKTTYEAGDAFDPAGLVVTGTYSEGDPKAITEGITWAVTPETLTEGLTSVSVVATVSGISSSPTTINGLTVNAASPTTSFVFNTDAGLSALGIAKPEASKGTELGTSNYTSGVVTMSATTGDGKTATRVWNSNGTTDLRIYATGTLTFTGATITKIELAGATVDGFTANVGTYTTNTWSGSATSVTLTATATEKINTITITYVAGSATETVATPVLPAADAFVGSKEITLSCETDGASIYYTLDGNDPTTASTLYSGAFTITETTTVKAIAVKDGMTNSAIASATYTKVVTLNSMDEIFAAATTAGSTATSKVITFDNWVISGVKNSNAYLTDNNGKGLIIFNKDANIDFEVGDILSGTATCNVQLYNGSAELTALTSATDGLTVTKGGVVTVKEIAVADLGGANTGAVIKLNNVSYTQDGTKYYFGDLQAYWNLMSAPASMTVGAKYDVTGVYVQYNTVKEILPRSEADVEAAASDVTLTSIAVSGTPTKTEYYTGDAFETAGLVVTGTYSDSHQETITEDIEWTIDPETLAEGTTSVDVIASVGSVVSEVYTVEGLTVTKPDFEIVTYDFSEFVSAATVELTDLDGFVITLSKGEGTTAPAWSSNQARVYVKGSLTVKANNAVIKSIEYVYAINANSKGKTPTIDGVAGTTNAGTWDEENKTWTGADEEVTFSTSGDAGNIGFTKLIIKYVPGSKIETSLEWSAPEATVMIGAIDNIFPTLTTTPADLTGVTYESSKASVATIAADGTITLIAPGETTITANYAGDETYAAATPVSYTLTVSKAPFVPTSVAEGYETVDFTTIYSSDEVVADYEGTSFEMIFAKPQSSSTPTKYYENGNAVRAYTGNTITINAADPILCIDIAWVSTYVDDAVNITGIGTTTAVVTFSKTCRFTAIKVVYKTSTIRSFTPGYIGTICLSQNATSLSGASFWTISYTKEGKLYVDEVTTGTLEAGVGYIFVPDADATEITGILYGAELSEAKLAVKGLQGTLTNITDGVSGAIGNKLEGNYLLYNNQIVQCGANCSLAANRAYIVLEEVPTEAPAKAPGVRRMSIPNANAPQTPTAIDNLTEDGVAARKVVVDGNLYIIRENKMYNANGQIVK